MTINKLQLRHRRQGRIRAKISGTATCPRLAVYRSLKHLRVQLIDDQNHVTLAAASDLEVKAKAKAAPKEIAHSVGELIAERSKALGINKIVFDRGGFAYHGRVQSLAEGARAGGLEF